MSLAKPGDRGEHGSERISVNPVFTREPLEMPAVTGCRTGSSTRTPPTRSCTTS